MPGEGAQGWDVTSECTRHMGPVRVLGSQKQQDPCPTSLTAACLPAP